MIELACRQYVLSASLSGFKIVKTFKRCYAWKYHMQLAMTENWLKQINEHWFQVLSLAFVHCHCITYSYIGNVSYIGNWHLRSVKECFESVGDKIILGRIIFLPTCVPVTISFTINLFSNRVTINLVPLHRPFFWLMLRSSIIGTPTFKGNLCFGSPDNSRKFKYSTVYKRLVVCSY